MKDTAAADATPGTVCVTGAAGFIGSWLVMRLLERGYIVRATVRDPGMQYNFVLCAQKYCRGNKMSDG